MRLQIEADLSREGLPRAKVLAAAVRLMDETLIRIGNEEYERQNQSYGVTTLHDEHVRIDGDCLQFEFRAKSGKEQHLRLRDPLLARILHASEELPGQDLFRYVDDHGHVVHINSADVNQYLRTTTAETFTAKDFRTWGGSVTAAEVLVGFGPPRSPADAKKKIILAIDAAAARLNNTRTVARATSIRECRIRGWKAGCSTRSPVPPRMITSRNRRSQFSVWSPTRADGRGAAKSGRVVRDLIEPGEHRHFGVDRRLHL